MTGTHVDRDRRCGNHSDHVPHPWDYGRRRCPGWGKYAADRAPAPAEDPCTVGWVGPTGVTWRCVAGPHHSAPGGYAGTGHLFRAVTGPRD